MKKKWKSKITIEVEVNEALMVATKEWRPRMVGWVLGVEWVHGRATVDGRTHALGDAWGHR